MVEITRNGSQASRKGPAEWFTGNVRIDPLFVANEARRAEASTVTFEPGARTAWHTHPLGQTLVVTAALASSSVRAGRSRKSAPVMLSGLSQVKNTGMALRHPL